MKQSFIKDLASIFKSRISIIVFNLVKVSIVARILGPEMNGTLAIIMVYPELFIIAGSMGVRKSSAFLIAKKTESKETLYKSILQLWIFTSLLSVCISFFLLKYGSTIDLSEHIIIIAISPIIFSILNNYMSGIYLGENKMKEFNQINWIPSLVNLIFVSLFLFFFNLKIEGVLLAIVLSQLTVSIILVKKIKILSYFSWNIDFKVIYKILKYGMSFALALLLLNLNYRLDIIMMDYLSTNFETGLYSKSVALVQYLWQVPALISILIFSRGASAKDSLQFSKKC